MDAAQALADLTAVSSQIQGAVIADAGGTVLASTFEDDRGGRVVAAAVELLAAADGVRQDGAGLVQLEAVVGGESVFLVREGGRIVAALGGSTPTVGLVFYDLKTCLRMLGDPEPEEPAKARRKKKETANDAS